MRIAYLGPEHSYTHLAARAAFGHKCKYIHAPSVSDVFHMVERRQVNHGIVPIENSLGGSVVDTLDRFVEFLDTPAKIQGEIELPIQHYLVMRRGAKIANINTVYSHPQAFTQCHSWLMQHLPKAFRWETNSTAEAINLVAGKTSAWFVKQRRPQELAAIGPRQLANICKLQSLPIPTEQENKTRFLILGLREGTRRKRCKTSIVFALKDRPGALHDALMPFKRGQINLTKIESRPSKLRAWEYYFFVDLAGYAEERRVAKALASLARHCTEFRVLGSYPVAMTPRRRQP